MQGPSKAYVRPYRALDRVYHVEQGHSKGYIIDKYVITQFSENIKERIVLEFIDNNFQSAYKDSLSKYLLEKINTDQIDFNSVKEYVLQIKDFNLLNEKDKFLHIKKLLEKDGTQN